MIIVCGTKRSGTSMWMQILKAAGLPVLGQQFFEGWTRFKDANPGGFYESQYRRGIPNVLQLPTNTCVKIFPRGLVLTNINNISGAIFTVRSVQEFVASRHRFWEIETNSTQNIPGIRPARRPNPAVEWWIHNLTWLRDLQARAYDARIVAYDSVLECPLQTIQRVLPWLQGSALEVTVSVVQSTYRTQKTIEPSFDPGIDGFPVDLAQSFYNSIRTATLTPELISDLFAADDVFRALTPIRVQLDILGFS